MKYKIHGAAIIFLLSVCLTPLQAATKQPTWIPTWYACPTPGWSTPGKLNNQTIREIVHVSAGGRLVRIRLSNLVGTTPLHLDQVHIALRLTGSMIDISSSKKPTFSGQPDVTIPPSSFVISDPVEMDIADQSDLAVSIYTANSVDESTLHGIQRSAIYLSDGNLVASNSASFAQQTGAPWVWLDEVEVADSPAKSAIAAFGDSITDGYLIPEESNKTWPDVLASHLSSAGIHEGVINAGISGNRLLHNGQGAPFGIAALARFDSDVLAQPNVKYVIVLLGINDIGQVDDNSPDVVNAQDIENGLTQLAERAHEHGMKIYAATLTPFKVTTIKNYYSDIKEVKRQAVNSWIRTNTIFDGFIDFDKAIDDPQNPGQMIPADDSGDHLHPNADGDTAMGKAIPLSWFK